MQVIIQKPCPFRQANELRAPTEYLPTLSYYNNDSEDLLWCKNTTQRVKAMYKYTSFYGLLLLPTNTSSLILWAPNYPKNILLQCTEAATTMSATTITYNTVSLCGHIGTSSVHSRPISGRRSEHKIYLHCWLFRESSIQNNRVSFGCCSRCLMLCRKRDGISI